MLEKKFFLTLAKLAHGNYWFNRDKHSCFPYQLWVTIDNQKYSFDFRFQWFRYLLWTWALASNNIKAGGLGIVYSNKVWRAWKLRHNILYRLHYKYDRPYGMGIHAVISKRRTMRLKHWDKVQYKEDQPKERIATGWHV